MHLAVRLVGDEFSEHREVSSVGRAMVHDDGDEAVLGPLLLRSAEFVQVELRRDAHLGVVLGEDETPLSLRCCSGQFAPSNGEGREMKAVPVINR